MKSAKRSGADRLLQRIVESAILSVKPSTIFRNRITLSDNRLTAFGRTLGLKPDAGVTCIAIGKSAEAMSAEIRKVLGARVSGMVATPVDRHINVEGFRFFKTGHPFPDLSSVQAGKMAMELVSSCRPQDALIFLISGGGSAAVFVPVPGVTLDDANRVISFALNNGVSIDRLNLLRRHISLLGGGKLATLAPKSPKLSLVISDVVGDHLPSIASGPTVADHTTPADAYNYLVESGMVDAAPVSITAALKKLSRISAGTVPERNEVVVVGSNSEALNAAENEGMAMGFNTMVLGRYLESDAVSAASFLVNIAASIEKDAGPVAAPALVLVGGETTVNVTGKGAGGRNQHLALNSLRELVRLRHRGVCLERSTIFSFGTDGRDGNSDAAGAAVSPALQIKFAGNFREIDDYIKESDSNSFFEKYGGLIKTGPTDTNVMDIAGVIVA